MKIAVLATNWKNTHGTGVARYTINLVEELKKHSNLEIVVIYMEGDDPLNYRIKGTKYTFPFKVILALNKLQPDLVYMHANWYFLLSGVVYKWLRGGRIITTIHSHPVELPYFGKLLMQYLLNSCDVVTYVSDDLRKKIHHVWAIPIKVEEVITYAGVQSKSVSNGEMKGFIEKYKIPKKSFILLMQSSPIAKVKANGTKILMQSVKKLSPQYPEILLIVTGTGPYLGELEEYAVILGIQEKVIFTGWVDNPFIPLSICDIYTHISLGEGLPLALLEAMSIGKPILATPVGGIPEVIDDGKNGLLVDPDIDAIAQAATTLLNDGELRTTLGHNAYVDSKKYTWERCANKFIDMFDGRY